MLSNLSMSFCLIYLPHSLITRHYQNTSAPRYEVAVILSCLATYHSVVFFFGQMDHKKLFCCQRIQFDIIWWRRVECCGDVNIIFYTDLRAGHRPKACIIWKYIGVHNIWQCGEECAIINSIFISVYWCTQVWTMVVWHYCSDTIYALCTPLTCLQYIALKGGKQVENAWYLFIMYLWTVNAKYIIFTIILIK